MGCGRRPHVSCRSTYQQSQDSSSPSYHQPGPSLCGMACQLNSGDACQVGRPGKKRQTIPANHPVVESSCTRFMAEVGVRLRQRAYI